MGRPSLAVERTEQIMNATRACLRQYGLASTTLERVSEESGLSRSHVRHYVGNRDDLLRSFADWLFTGYQSALEELVDGTSADQRLAAMVDYLFGTGFLPVSDDDAVIRELITAGLNDETLHAMMQSRYERALDLIAAAVRDSRPELGEDQARVLAYGVWALALGNSTLAEIGLAEASSASPRVAVESLIEALAPHGGG